MQRNWRKRRSRNSTPHTVVLVAGGLLQVPMARAIKRRGYILAIADNNEQCIGRELADVFLACDIQSTETLIPLVQKINRIHPVAFAITAATDFSRQVAAINRMLSRDIGISRKTAMLTTDKANMRTILRKHNLTVPRSLLVTETDNIANGTIPLPAVVKPSDNMGGRGVKLIRTYDELPAAIREAQSYSQQEQVLCEEYIADTEYSVEMLVRNYRPHSFIIATRYIYCQPFFIEMGHFLPATLSRRTRRQIRSACQKAIRTVGIQHGVAKFDLFHRNNRTTINEIACRLSGGYMSGWTFPHARGYDLNEKYLTIIEKKIRHRTPRHTHTRPHQRAICSGECAMLSIPGCVASIRGVQVARNIPGVTHIFTRYCPGEEVSFPKNNVQKFLNIIIVAKNITAFWDTAHAARKAIDIRLASGHEKTLAFLFGDAGKNFPMTYSAPSALLLWLQPRQRKEKKISVDTNPLFATPPHIPSLRDWHQYSLHGIVTQLCHEYQPTISNQQHNIYNRAFWRAIMKGGLQGGRFFFDTLKEKKHLLKQWIEKWDGNISDV